MGAKCVGDSSLNLCEEIWSELKAVQLKWVHTPGGRAPASDNITLPVYHHPTRQHLLFTLDFKADKGLQPSVFYERGVALICTTQLG